MNRTAIDEESDFSSDEAILIEYLDGELGAQERQIIEERLAKEPLFRDTLEHLEKSWNCLDLLERADGSKEAVEITLETVILQTEEDISKQEKQNKRRFPKSIAAAVFIAVCFSFLFFRLGTEIGDRNFWFRRAFPIIEKLDMYLMLEETDPDLQLLHLLAEKRIFLPEKTLSHGSIYEVPLSYSSNYETLKQLDAPLYNKLYRNEKKFSQLKHSDKETLRKLHERIISSPQSAELLLTLYNYYQWFRTLQSYEKAELRQKKLSPALRCEKITDLKRKLEENQLAVYQTPSGYSSSAVPFQTLNSSDTQSLFREYAEKLRQLDTRELNRVLDAAPEQLPDMLKE